MVQLIYQNIFKDTLFYLRWTDTSWLWMDYYTRLHLQFVYEFGYCGINSLIVTLIFYLLKINNTAAFVNVMNDGACLSTYLKCLHPRWFACFAERKKKRKCLFAAIVCVYCLSVAFTVLLVFSSGNRDRRTCYQWAEFLPSLASFKNWNSKGEMLLKREAALRSYWYLNLMKINFGILKILQV